MKKAFSILFLLSTLIIHAQDAKLSFVEGNKFTLSEGLSGVAASRSLQISNENIAFYSSGEIIQVFSIDGLRKLYTIKKPTGFTGMVNTGSDIYAIVVDDQRTKTGEITIFKQKLGGQQWGEAIEVGKLNLGILKRGMISPFKLRLALNGVGESSVLTMFKNSERTKWIGYTASYGNNNGNENFQLIYFDKDLSKIEKTAKVELKYLEDNFQLSEMHVTREGKLLVLGDEYMDKGRKTIVKDKPGYKTHLIVIDENGQVESDQVLSHEDNFFNLKVTERNNTYYLDGLMAKADNADNLISTPVGYINFKLEASSNFKAQKNTIVFSADQVTKIKHGKKSEGLIFNINYFENGSRLFTVSNAKGGVRGVFNGALSDSYALLIGQDNKIVKEFSITKKCSSPLDSGYPQFQSDHDIGFGVMQFNSGNKVCIMFNDLLANSNLSSDQAETYKGKMKESGIKLIIVDENGEASVKFIHQYSDADKGAVCYNSIMFGNGTQFILQYHIKVSGMKTGGAVSLTGEIVELTLSGIE